MKLSFLTLSLNASRRSLTRMVSASALLIIGSFYLLCSSAPAQVQTQSTDPDLPQPFNPATLDSVVTTSPFTRSLNLSDSLVLTGIAYIDGKPVATVFNTEKKESYVVSEQPNAQGWKLAETNATIQLDKTQAKIMIGTEIVTVRYSKEQLTPESMKPKVQQSGGPPDGGGRWGDRDRDRGGEDRGRFRPDPEVRRRFEALSDDSRRKIFEEMRANPERMNNLSQDERTAYMNRLLDRAERQNQSGGGGSNQRSTQGQR